MKFSSLFISRPVLTLVVNIAVVFFGALSARMLGVRDYPAVDPPVISVRTSYQGANADVIESKITEPLEQSINGIGGIRTLTSSSSDGSSNVTVEFNLGTDLEAAANDVRDRVSRAKRSLPEEADDPVVSKADANSSPIITITLQSETRSQVQLTNYAATVFQQRLQTIDQVSEVGIWGEKRLAMRLWLDPARMASRGVTPQDIKAALDRENVELPSGRIEGATTELSVRTMGSLSSATDFNNLIIRGEGDATVRLKDVGDAVEGIEDERSIVKLNGVPMIGVAIVPQPGANHIAISNEFYKRLEQIKRDLPADVRVGIGFDTTKNVRKSVTEVAETIALAFLLVVLVIFAFLRDWRATLIPVLAMPISLIGSFFVMNACGFSINILTLLAVVLATGLVVDDAIVVLENIYRKIEAGESPVAAGHKGASEIFFAVIATTLAIGSVLLPIMLMPGMTGRLFREFGAVLAGSVMISAFVSLSLTPMLCTRVLRHHNPGERSLYAMTEPFFASVIEAYRRSLTAFLRHRAWALPVIGAAAVMIVGFYAVLPRELAPMEDRGRLQVSATGAEGASFDFMRTAMDQVDNVIRQSVPELDAAIVRAPGGRGGGGVNSGSVSVMLSDADKRKRSQDEIALALTKDLRRISSVRANVSQEQTISAGGGRGGLPVQYILLAPDLDRLREKLPLFLSEASQDPTFLSVDANMKFNKPEIRIAVDREKARDVGVSTLDISQTLQLALAGARYGTFVRDGDQYSVVGQFARTDRSTPLDLSSITVRARDGAFVQLGNMVQLSEANNPPQLYRYNRSLSATVSAGLAPGKTIADGIDAMDKIAARLLDKSYTTDLSGPSRDFKESSSSLLLTFAFALALVYLVLAAQFESFRNPFIVMFTVPLALAGAFFSLWYFGQSLNIFSQIGIIMLVGLVAKNGILIVEFANQRRIGGMALYDAVIDAAASRFRPIVMTSLTVMLGSLPIALALGAGAKSRVSLGIVVIGGLLFSLVLSLYVVPAMYTYLSAKVARSGDGHR